LIIEFEIRTVYYVYITKTLKNVEICKIHYVYIANTLKTCFFNVFAMYSSNHSFD